MKLTKSKKEEFIKAMEITRKSKTRELQEKLAENKNILNNKILEILQEIEELNKCIVFLKTSSL